MGKYIVNKVKELAQFLSDNIVGVIVVEFVLLFIFWSIGYFGNGLYGTKFDLGSCWAGVTAIFGTAVMGGLQKILGYAQYKVDSVYNSPKDVAPGSVNISINQSPNLLKDEDK